jgi:hypothetical protein
MEEVYAVGIMVLLRLVLPIIGLLLIGTEVERRRYRSSR